jgi:hypothetical protein
MSGVITAKAMPFDEIIRVAESFADFLGARPTPE